VLKDSPIRRVEDLKGKVLATNGAGSASDIPLRYMLKKHGMIDKRDFSMIEVAVNNMYSILSSGKADLVTKSSTTMRDSGQAENVRQLFDARDALGVTEFSFFCARASFLNPNRARLADFFDDLVRIARWYAEPKNRDEAVKMLSGVLRQPPEETASYYLIPAQDTYRDANAHPDPAALQRNEDAMQELGFLKEHVDVAKHTDLSFVDAAAKRLGPRVIR
jgi:sulfonate transport system substrate-binding protein